MPLPFHWPDNRHAAVSLTYDDGLPVHHEDVAPALNAHGLRATFYTPIDSNLMDEPDAWRAVAAAGHELGNHTVFHPCRKTDDRQWVIEPYDLSRYTLARWEREVGLANRVLSTIDGRTLRSYGNTCHDQEVGPDHDPASIQPSVMKFFSAARGPLTQRVIDPAACSLTALGCCSADGQSFEALRDRIDEAIERGGWVIFCAHGVGRDHHLLWDAEEHELTLEYLAHRRDAVWCAPMTDVAEYIEDSRCLEPS